LQATWLGDLTKRQGPMEKFALVTGTSRGVGAALLPMLLADGWTVLGISRSTGSTVQSPNFYSAALDLTEVGSARGLEDALAVVAKFKGLTRVALVNNAASLEPVGNLANVGLQTLAGSFLINTCFPMWLAHKVLALFVEQNVVVVNLSSGAASNPYAGWSSYCATKAALAMSTRVCREELGLFHRKKPALLVDYAPGVVDTQMQEQVRTSDPQQFPMVAKFRQLHNQGALVPASEPAGEIYRLCRQEFAHDEHLQVRYPISEETWDLLI
jgi:benzil reductase ((S)-benzoin forming)